MLEDAKAPILLPNRGWPRTSPARPTRVICVDDPAVASRCKGHEANLPPLATADHLCYSFIPPHDRQPKGSLITHRNVARLLSATEHWYGFNEHDVWTRFIRTRSTLASGKFGAPCFTAAAGLVPYLVSRSPEAFYELLAAELRHR